MDSDLPNLNPAEARVLGCLAEKKELTPDVYPMTLNGLQSAVNQKTARDPVMDLDQGEVLRALKLLQDKGLVRQVYGSRVERYEHLLAQSFSLTQPQIALVGLLLLRGPQTAHELLARSERLARFGSMESLDTELDLLIGRRPPLVKLLARAPRQREERYAHLLSGDVQTPVAVRAAPERAVPPGFESRLQALEEQVAALQAKLDALGRADG